MNTNDRDHPTDDGFADVLGGLETLARTLDAQEYPGEAWGAAKRPPARRLAWRIAASLAAAAALVAVAIHYRATSPPRIGPAAAGENAVAQAAAPSVDLETDADAWELAISEIVLVEDLDSYSFIDLTGDVPLVSFATKDSYTPVSVVPLLPEPSS